MNYRRYCIVILSCLSTLSVLLVISNQYALKAEVFDWKVELKQIDEEIERAEDLKNRYLASARRAEDEGMRWQFQQDEKQEAIRAFHLAEEKKQAAQLMQNRIDELNLRKLHILQAHPGAHEL